MFKTKGTLTTGQVVSRLGVLSVLCNNLIQENHLDPEVREGYGREIEATMNGLRGVPDHKVMVRSVERCASGTWN